MSILVGVSGGPVGVLTAYQQGPAGPSVSITGTGLAYVLAGVIETAAVTLTGDVSQGAVSGSNVPLTVTGLQNIALPAPSGSSTVLTYNAGAYTWAASSGSTVTGTGLWYSVSGTLHSAATTLTGDVSQGALSGSNIPLTVTGLQGVAVPSVSSGFLRYNGAAFVFTGITTALLPNGTAAQILQTNAGATAAVWTTMSGDGIIGATGILSVTSVHGTTVPAGGSLTTGNQLIVSGSSAATWAALNLAGGSGYVSGTLPIGNVGSPTGTGVALVSGGVWVGAAGTVNLASATYVTGTLQLGNGGTGLNTASGLTVGNTLGVATGTTLAYSALNLAGGAGYVTGALPAANIAPGTSGQVFMSNATPAAAWTTISQDATVGATGAWTNTQAQGGEYVFGAGGTMTWATGATPLITQASTSSSATPSPFKFSAQASTASNNNGGVIQLDIPASSGSGTEGWVSFTRAGASGYAAIGPYSQALPTYASLWLGTSGSFTTANFTINGSPGGTTINAPGGTLVALGVGGANFQAITAAGIEFFNGGTADFGGGSGVIGMAPAAGVPTSLASTSVNIYTASGQTFGINGKGLTWSAFSTWAESQTAPAAVSSGSGTAANAATMTAQAGGATSGAAATGGAGASLTITAGTGGNATGTGATVSGNGGTLTLSSGPAGGTGATAGTGGNVVLQWGQGNVALLTLGTAGINLASNSQTIAATGNTNASTSVLPYPIIRINAVSLTGAATLTFPNSFGTWFVDVSQITVGAGSLAFKSGTATSPTVSVGSVATQLVMVTTYGSNTISINT